MNARALEPAADEGAFAIAEGLPWSVHIGSAKGILPTMPVPHQQAIRGAVRDGCTAEDVRMLTDWLLNSGEHDGGWWRSKGHGWGPVLKDWRSRVKVAREWSRAGRPTGPPSRAAPLPMHLRIGRAEGPAPPSDTPLWSSLTPAQQIEAIERLGFDGVDDSEWPRVMEQEAAKILEARQ